MRKATFYYSILVFLLGIACALFQAQLYIRIVCVVLVVIAIMLILKYSKCSECGEYGVNLNSFSNKFGVCKKCNHKEQ
jgi:formylmethanofuran dehydrogenase subunit E